MISRSFTSAVALAVFLTICGNNEVVSAFGILPARPSSARGDISTYMAEVEVANEKMKNQVTHLQKKLRYWKQEKKAKEEEYKLYQTQQSLDPHRKPIYRREGKIDHYSIRPVYDQQTERIQTEIWSVKEHIKVAQAQLHEERRVEQVRKETALRLARHDDEIQTLQQRAEAERKEAARKLQEMQNESSARLTEKEQLIAAVTKDIQNLSNQLNMNREALKNKENRFDSMEKELKYSLDTLEQELKQKEAILHHLGRERASLRALVKQSWRLMKDRFKKHILHRANDHDGELDDIIQATLEKEAAEEKVAAPAVEVREREKVLV